MKQRFTWAVALLVVLLLMVVASCAPAVTPTSTLTPILGQRRGVNGTLTKINGNILTLTTALGPMTVKIISDNTTIQNVTTGTRSDLQAGGYLIAVGPLDTNGNITATSIMIRLQVQGAPPTPPEGASPANPRYSPTGARRRASGTITKINGNILTVTTAQGIVMVNVGPDTAIQKTVAGTLSDLHEGQSLTVIGRQDANGNVTATSIIVQSQGQGAPATPPSGS